MISSNGNPLKKYIKVKKQPNLEIRQLSQAINEIYSMQKKTKGGLK